MSQLIELCIIGMALPYLLDYCGMLCGEAGIQYYGEVHQSSQNALVHTLGMPVTSYGLIKMVPALFGFDRKKAHRLQKSIFGLYLFHYFSIQPLIGISFLFFYRYPIIYAMRHYQNTVGCALHGLCIATISLVSQEYFGHYLSGDPPSRLEGVPNAILYSNFFAIRYFWKVLGILS